MALQRLAHCIYRLHFSHRETHTVAARATGTDVESLSLARNEVVSSSELSGSEVAAT